MICRAKDNGWLLITQTAHAWMAGQLAAGWGNDTFTPPEPRDAILLATSLHDIGWSGWDAAPRLDHSGQPVDFLGLTLDETIPIWRHGVQQVGMLSPYAALLVSLHATTVYRRRLERGVDPPEQRNKVQEMLAEQTAVRAEIAKRLSGHSIYGPLLLEEGLAAIYRWLRACDLLSLAVLSDKLPPTGEINPVPGYDLFDLQVIRYARQDDYTLAIHPWPFTLSSYALIVEARYLKIKKFTDLAEFHSLLTASEWQPIEVTFQPMRPA